MQLFQSSAPSLWRKQSWVFLGTVRLREIRRVSSDCYVAVLIQNWRMTNKCALLCIWHRIVHNFSNCTFILARLLRTIKEKNHLKFLIKFNNLKNTVYSHFTHDSEMGVSYECQCYSLWHNINGVGAAIITTVRAIPEYLLMQLNICTK